MRALDILAVVSGVTGTASFALMMLDRFSQWRRYLAPVSAFLIGYALSVVSMLLFPSMAMGVSHEHSWPVIIIILALVGAIRYSDLAEKAASDSATKIEIQKKLLRLRSSLVNAAKP
jgi:hypothetical protein